MAVPGVRGRGGTGSHCSGRRVPAGAAGRSGLVWPHRCARYH